MDPEYHLKKKRVEELRYKLPVDSVLLFYEDEKGGPIVFKTYDGTSSWSSIQSKVSKAQKIKGILNVFGIYVHTNNNQIRYTPTNKR